MNTLSSQQSLSFHNSHCDNTFATSWNTQIQKTINVIVTNNQTPIHLKIKLIEGIKSQITDRIGQEKSKNNVSMFKKTNMNNLITMVKSLSKQSVGICVKTRSLIKSYRQGSNSSNNILQQLRQSKIALKEVGKMMKQSIGLIQDLKKQKMVQLLSLTCKIHQIKSLNQRSKKGEPLKINNNKQVEQKLFLKKRSKQLYNDQNRNGYLLN